MFSKDLKPLYPTGLFPTAFFLHKNLLVLVHLNVYLYLYLYLFLYLYLDLGKKILIFTQNLNKFHGNNPTWCLSSQMLIPGCCSCHFHYHCSQYQMQQHCKVLMLDLFHDLTHLDHDQDHHHGHNDHDNQHRHDHDHDHDHYYDHNYDYDCKVLMPDTAGLSFTTSFTSLIRVHKLSKGFPLVGSYSLPEGMKVFVKVWKYDWKWKKSLPTWRRNSATSEGGARHNGSCPSS